MVTTDTVHVAPAANVPLANVMLPGLPVLVTVPPPHCGEAGAVETVTPVGNVSLKATLERLELAFGLVIVKVNVLVAPV